MKREREREVVSGKKGSWKSGERRKGTWSAAWRSTTIPPLVPIGIHMYTILYYSCPNSVIHRLHFVLDFLSKYLHSSASRLKGVSRSIWMRRSVEMAGIIAGVPWYIDIGCYILPGSCSVRRQCKRPVKKTQPGLHPFILTLRQLRKCNCEWWLKWPIITNKCEFQQLLYFPPP